MRFLHTFARAALAAIALVACDREEDDPTGPPVDLSWQTSEAIAESFGAGVDATLELARVHNHPITLGEAALYLRYFPALTVEQAVEDLIDLHLASHALSDEAIEVDESALRIARLRARAWTWVQHAVHRDPANNPADAQIDALANDVSRRVELGVPPLATASHVLVLADAALPAAERARAASVAERFATLARDRGVDTWTTLSLLANQLPASFDLEGFELHLDGHITFPRRFSGPRSWQGVDAVVEAFADAAFDHPPGSLVGPVETQFGFHVIVVESHDPGTIGDEDDLREAARRLLLVRHRIEATNQHVARLARDVEVSFDRDTVQLLGLDSVQRAQAQHQIQTSGVAD